MPKSVSYAAIERRAEVIAKETGRNKVMVIVALRKAHEDQGITIDESEPVVNKPPVASDKNLNFADGAGEENPVKTYPRLPRPRPL